MCKLPLRLVTAAPTDKTPTRRQIGAVVGTLEEGAQSYKRSFHALPRVETGNPYHSPATDIPTKTFSTRGPPPCGRTRFDDRASARAVCWKNRGPINR